MTPSDFIAACEIAAVSLSALAVVIAAFGAVHFGRPL